MSKAAVTPPELVIRPAYYFQIMLPGAMVGLIVGYATQKYGAASQVQRAGA